MLGLLVQVQDDIREVSRRERLTSVGGSPYIFATRCLIL